MQFDLTTFVFELINFGLLLWILERVLYRPLRAGIENRRAGLAAERERAAESLADAQALREGAEARLSEIEKLRESIVADAREQAAKEESRILDQARKDAAIERERGQRTLDRERREAVAWLREATVENSVDVAGRLLLDLFPDAADDVLMQSLLESIESRRAMSSDDLANIQAVAGRVPVELRMPGAPREESLASLRRNLEALLQVPFELVVREDESLLAGPVLRIGDHVFDASVAGHLEIVKGRAHALAESTDA